MILEDQDIINLLSVNPIMDLLDSARKKSAILNLHITGDGMKNAVETMPYFEDEQRKNLRQKYARSNRDIFSRLHRPIDKVFTAKGGSITYNIPEAKQSQFSACLADIRNGMSLRKWIEQVALPAFHIDPMGIIFMEIDQNGKIYPTYKSTTDVYTYKINGRRLEYVIFQLSIDDVKKLADMGVAFPEVKATIKTFLDSKSNGETKTQFYRVVDDVSDKIIAYDGKTFTVIDDMTLLNPWMYVPAMIISDIIKYNSDEFLSPDDVVVELANSYLTDCSVFEIWKKLHGFPKHWRFASDCSSCAGTGKVQGRQCPDCDGTGKRKKTTVRDELVIPLPDGGDVKYPSEWMGYSTPPIEGWTLMTEEQQRLEALMHCTLWGVNKQQVGKQQDNGDKTATEIQSLDKSMHDRLKDFSDWAESIETFITDAVGEILYLTAYQGCAINYGDRYVLELPDVIWDKYKTARAAGSPQATLDGLLRDYYESRYEGSPIDLRKALKLMRVEPWTHLTIQQVQNLTITDQDKAAKIYFSEWVSTKGDMDIIMTDEVALRADLIAYASAKVVVIQAQEAAEAAKMQPADNLQAPVQRSTNERVTT